MFSMCLKMVYSKGVFLFPELYTVNIDPLLARRTIDCASMPPSGERLSLLQSRIRH
jgi:hypothetical protein